MKITFNVKGVTGEQMAARFRAAIKEEGVGWDEQSRATLHTTKDGDVVWTTAWSRFTYAVVNPDSTRPCAVVEYEGAVRGFLAQELLPKEVRENIAHLWISGGSVFDALPEGTHFDADGSEVETLREAYRLLQGKAFHQTSPGYGRDPVEVAQATIDMAFETARAAARLDGEIKTVFPNSGAYALPVEENSRRGEFYLTTHFPLNGREVSREWEVWGEKPQDVANEAVAWLRATRRLLESVTA